MVEEARPSNLSTGPKRLSLRGRQIVLQIVVGMVILACGVIIGFSIAVLLYKNKIVPPPGPRPPTRAVIEDMEARYNLTPEQAKKVEAAFSKRRETLRTLFEEFRTKSEAEFKTLSTEIKKILTPEQYVRWEQDFKRQRRPGPPWERGPGKPGERGPGRRGPDGRGPDDRRNFRRGPGRDFHEQRGPNHDPWEPNTPGPNTPGPFIPSPGIPEQNAPTDL